MSCRAFTKLITKWGIKVIEFMWELLSWDVVTRWFVHTLVVESLFSLPLAFGLKDTPIHHGWVANHKYVITNAITTSLVTQLHRPCALLYKEDNDSNPSTSIVVTIKLSNHQTKRKVCYHNSKSINIMKAIKSTYKFGNKVEFKKKKLFKGKTIPRVTISHRKFQYRRSSYNRLNLQNICK